VAYILELPHVSLYKQINGTDKAELIHTDGTVEPINSDNSLKGYYVHHIVDLVTKGSSIYAGADTGWLPMLRNRGARIDCLTAVIDRLHGAKEMLEGQGVRLNAFVTIDGNFLRKHSKNPEEAVAYFQNTRGWSENYLRQNGALAFLDDFNPVADNSRKIKSHRFLYGCDADQPGYLNFLEEIGRFDELKDAVLERYGIDVSGEKYNDNYFFK
jgi:hypothetical protein